MGVFASLPRPLESLLLPQSVISSTILMRLATENNVFTGKLLPQRID